MPHSTGGFSIKAPLADRPAPKANCVFLTPTGRRWGRLTRMSCVDLLSIRFNKLMKEARSIGLA